MSLETRLPRQPSELPRDKPQVDRAEHDNLERAHAQLHPRARTGQDPARRPGWAACSPRGGGWH